MASTNQMVLQCDQDVGRRRRLSEEALKSEDNEVRGVMILVVCGLYAISMFFLAKLVSYFLGSVSASVKSMLFSVQMKTAAQTTGVPSQLSQLSPIMRKPLQTRPLNHG